MPRTHAGMSTLHRVQAGVPAGGQFAATQHAEADIELADEPDAQDYGVGYDGPDQSHVKVFEDGRGGHTREDGQPGFTCPNCRSGYASKHGLGAHDCTALNDMTDEQVERLAAADAWNGIDITNNDPIYRVAYSKAATAIADRFPSAPGYEMHSGTTRLKREPTGAMYEARTGAKYTSNYRRAVDIAKDVRADIKAAVESGVLPESINGRKLTFSVTTHGGSSIDLTISGIADADLYSPHRQHPWGDRQRSDLARDIERRANSIRSAYNQSRSEMQVDYFDETYYGGVSLPNEQDVVWAVHTKAQDKAKAEIRKMKRDGAPRSVIEEKIVAFRSANDAYRRSHQEYQAHEDAAKEAWRASEREYEERRQAAIAARKAAAGAQ